MFAQLGGAISSLFGGKKTQRKSSKKSSRSSKSKSTKRQQRQRGGFDLEQQKTLDNLIDFYRRILVREGELALVNHLRENMRLGQEDPIQLLVFPIKYQTNRIVNDNAQKKVEDYRIKKIMEMVHKTNKLTRSSSRSSRSRGGAVRSGSPFKY